MLDCEKHGLQSAVMISEDLLTDPELAPTGISRIGFADRDVVVGIMLVSSAVATENEITDGSVLQLEVNAELPAWAESIKRIACVKCFAERTGIEPRQLLNVT